MWKCPKCGESTDSDDVLTCWNCLFEVPVGDRAVEQAEADWEQLRPPSCPPAPEAPAGVISSAGILPASLENQSDEEPTAADVSEEARPSQFQRWPAEVVAEPEPAGPRDLPFHPDAIDCVYCGRPLARLESLPPDHIVRRQFSSPFLRSLAGRSEIETYVCLHCGRLDFFVSALGSEFRPE